MKNALTFILAFVLIGCLKKEDSKDISQIQQEYLQSLVQEFEVDAADGEVSLESNGCTILLNTEHFLLEGEKVEGVIDIEFIEIFDRGTMAMTGKHTMSEDGLLSSGGEFFIKAYSGGQELNMSGRGRIEAPISLTGERQDGMMLFYGGDTRMSDEEWSLVEESTFTSWISTLIDVEVPFYNIYFDQLSWFNCDRFTNYPEQNQPFDLVTPQDIREGEYFVYLTIKGEGAALGSVFQDSTYPLGIEVNLIYITSDPDTKGGLLHHIISTEHLEDNQVVFKKEDLQPIDMQQLVTKINSLP